MTETSTTIDPTTADVARFNKLAHTPVETLAENPTQGFAHLNSAEMLPFRTPSGRKKSRLDLTQIMLADL